MPDGAFLTHRAWQVDLAGSERAKKSGVQHQQFEELKAINLSLSALGNCIAALGQGRPHVPYRDSRLTRLLQHSLGGNARTALIVTLAPRADESGENLSTLQFAQRAAAIQVAAKLNSEVDYATLYAQAQAQLDARDDAANAREIEAAALRSKLEEAELAAEALGAERDKLALRLERAETT